MTKDQITATLELMGWRFASNGAFKFDTHDEWRYTFIDNAGKVHTCFGPDEGWVEPNDLYLEELRLILHEAQVLDGQLKENIWER